MAFNMRSMSSALRSVPVKPVTATRALPTSHIGKASMMSRPASLSHGLFVSNGCTVTAMRHGCHKPKLNKPADQRKALVRSLVTEVIRHGKITTTKVRAKAIRPYVDKMVTLAKDGSLHARRQALGFIYDKDLVHRLFAAAPARYGERNGGYCRVMTAHSHPELLLRPRRGDNVELAVIELVE